MTSAPLHGIRALDFTELLPGPFLTQSLVEMGATVIKVERPPQGDPVRQSSPGLFGVANRGKTSIAIDLKSENGRAEAIALAESCDVLVEGFRPGVMARLGLGYEALAARYPRLVYLSMSGYGQEGPLAQVPGHDLNYLAQAGIISLCGEAGGEPAHAFGLPVADLCGSTYGLAVVLAALLQRERTGRGQHIDLALSDCVAHWANARRGPYHYGSMNDLAAQRRFALIRPAYGVYACRDGAVTIAALEGHFWRHLVRVLDLAKFAGEEYGAQSRRAAEAETINAAIAAKLKPMKRDEAVALLLNADVPVSPVLSLNEAAGSEHFRVRGLIAETEAGGLMPFPVRLAGMEATPKAVPALDSYRQEQ